MKSRHSTHPLYTTFIEPHAHVEAWRAYDFKHNNWYTAKTFHMILASCRGHTIKKAGISRELSVGPIFNMAVIRVKPTFRCDKFHTFRRSADNRSITISEPSGAGHKDLSKKSYKMMGSTSPAPESNNAPNPPSSKNNDHRR